ncbi:MAG: hypothetical protein Aurels2KO_04980 [Aureliella sp.]
MSYWRYWQLEAAPFSGQTPWSLFKGATVEEALARIDFLVGHRRRLGTLVGQSGVGKTALLRYFAATPATREASQNVQFLKTSMLGKAPGELVVELATRLTGDRRNDDPTTAWLAVCDYFNAAEREEVQTTLLVDDAESSTAGAEADLSRLLSKSFPLTVILAIESQLISAVSRTLMEQTELQIELPAWELSQTGEFLAWMSQTLGRKEPIFTDRAIEQIQQLSGGNPRRIVQLADLALVAGAVSQLDFIDVDCIEQVAWELPNSNAA